MPTLHFYSLVDFRSMIHQTWSSKICYKKLSFTPKDTTVTLCKTEKPAWGIEAASSMETSVTKPFFMYGTSWEKKFVAVCCLENAMLLHTKLPIFGQNWLGKQDWFWIKTILGSGQFIDCSLCTRVNKTILFFLGLGHLPSCDSSKGLYSKK